MIRRIWQDLEDRYVVTTDDGAYILIVTQCYTTACEYDQYARLNVGPITLTKFQNYVRRHRKYWQEDLKEELLETKQMTDRRND